MTWQAKIIDPDSTEWTLTGSADRVSGEMIGLGAPEHEHFIEQIPFLPGAFRAGGIDHARMITMNVTHVAAPGGAKPSTTSYQSQLFDDREDFVALIDPSRGESRFQWTLPNGKTWEIRGYAFGRPDMPSGGRPISWIQPFTLQFYCPIPYWYDPDAYNVSTNPDGIVTATLTFSGTSTVTTSLPYAAASDGYVTGYPHTFTIAADGAAAVNDPDVWIGSTASMNFNSTAGYDLANGNTITITVPPWGRFKAEDGGTRIDGYLKKDDLTSAFPIPLGGGTLSATASNAGADGTVTLVYRQLKRGI